MADSADAGPQRRRLVLKARDPDAAAKLEAERQAHLGKQNPFGAAKPREAVIAEKLGKTEEEVLKDEVAKDKLHLRLSGPQLDEKREAEAACDDLKEALTLEEDAGKRAEIEGQLRERQQKLDDLMEQFAKATLEMALSGGAPRVSQIREQQALREAEGGGPPGAGGAGGYGQRYGAPDQYGGGGGGGGGGSFGGRDYNEGRGGGGAGGGGGRGFKNYQDRGQDRGGFTDNYQQPERQGGGGRRGQRLPEWAQDDVPADAGFYDAPAATSAFIASGGYQGGAGGAPGGAESFGSGSFGSGGRGGGGRGGRGGGGRGGGAGAGFSGRGLGGEIDYQEGDTSFGAGQDRF